MNIIQKYLESPEVKGLAKSTRELYGYVLGHLENFMKESPALGCPAAICHEKFEVVSSNLGDFATYLESKGLSGKSVQQYLNCTKIFLKWAGYPTEFTYRIPNKDRQENKRKHLDRWFTEEDIEKCLAYRFNNGNVLTASTRALEFQVVVRLLVETGARVGEIAGIRMEDIHLYEMCVFIQGKTEPRPVVFSRKTAVLLAELLANAEYKKTHCVINNKTSCLFPNVDKIKSEITRMLQDLGLKNGKDGRGPHTFRHYTATYLFYTGNMRIEDIAFLLGDKVETIRERYLHPTPKMIRDRVYKAWEAASAQLR